MAVDYTGNYAPVISDITYHILLICEIFWRLTSKKVDVKTAFLHGELEEGDIRFILTVPMEWNMKLMNAFFCKEPSMV
jgi:hypothetical protein